jgi:hypothetical protein
VTAPLRTLIDSGANRIGYINRDLARNLKLCLTLLTRTIHPTRFNGKQLEGGSISYVTSVSLTYQNHKETITLYVTNTRRHNLILGQPWLYLHRVAFDYQNQVLKFEAPRCQVICLCRHLQQTRTTSKASLRSKILPKTLTT